MAYGDDAYGFKKWKPSGDNVRRAEVVVEILDKYSAQKPLTVRQIFYIMVSQYGYTKSEGLYRSVDVLIGNMRRSKLVSFDDIHDPGFVTAVPSEFADSPAFWGNVRNKASNFRLKRQRKQPVFVELWCETEGMVSQLRTVAFDYGVPVFSGGGTPSITGKYNAGKRFANRKVPTVVLYVGDLDRSGLNIYNDLRRDSTVFCRDLGGKFDVSFQRIAITDAQVVTLGIEKSPAQPTGTRGWPLGYYAQAEAIPPNNLRAIIHEELQLVIDMDRLAKTLKREARERAAILGDLGDLGR